MVPGAEHCRLAVTTFEEPERLWRAVAALLDAGLATEQICLVGLASTMARFAATVSGTPDQVRRATALFSDLHDWPGTSDSQLIVGTSGELLRALLQAQAISVGPNGETSTSIRKKLDLEGQVRDGNIALVVGSSGARQQLLTTRNLLAISSHRVLAYEFSLRASPVSSQPR